MATQHTCQANDQGDFKTDETWLTDERINAAKTGAELTNEEVLALLGEVRVRRRAMQAESWRDRPSLL